MKRMQLSIGMGSIVSLIVVYFIYLYASDPVRGGIGWIILSWITKVYLIVVIGIIALGLLVLLLISLVIFSFFLYAKFSANKYKDYKKEDEALDARFREIDDEQEKLRE